MYGSGPRVATRYASALGRKARARTGSGFPVKGIERRSSSSAAFSRRCRGVSGSTTPWRMIASRSAFSTDELELLGPRSGRDQAHQPRSRGRRFTVALLGRWRRIRVSNGESQGRVVRSPHRQPLEVPADRRAHVLEVALVAHGRSFPTAPTSPSSARQRGEPNVAVQTTVSPSPRRPDARAGAAPTSRKLEWSTFARCGGD